MVTGLYTFIHTMLYDPSIRFPSDSIQPLLLKGHVDFRFRSDRRLVPWSSPKTIGGFSPSRHVCVSVFWLWYLYRYIYIYTYMWGSYPKVSKLMITVILCHIKCLKFIRMFFTAEIVDCVLFLDPEKDDIHQIL